MTDTSAVHIGVNSAEEVAFKLLHCVAVAEGKSFTRSPTAKSNVDRKWILDTYAECLSTVLAPHHR